MMTRAKVLGGALLVAAVMSGCATQQVETKKDIAFTPVSGDAPSGPPNMFKDDRSMTQASATIAAAPKKQPTGFEKTLKHMEENPLTLYRSNKKAYTYYIGNLLEAEYKLDKGLTLRKNDSQDQPLVCKYNMEGDLNSASANPKEVADAQRACADLMFTFDKQLSE